MLKKTALIIVILAVGILAAMQISDLFVIRGNTDTFTYNLLSIPNREEDVLDLSSLAPFEWEKLYVFDPYTTKADIQRVIGFEWYAIRKNTNDDDMQMIFVNKDRVTGYCHGPASKKEFLITRDGSDESLPYLNNGKAKLLYDKKKSEKRGYMCYTIVRK